MQDVIAVFRAKPPIAARRSIPQLQGPVMLAHPSPPSAHAVSYCPLPAPCRIAGIILVAHLQATFGGIMVRLKSASMVE